MADFGTGRVLLAIVGWRLPSPSATSRRGPSAHRSSAPGEVSGRSRGRPTCCRSICFRAVARRSHTSLSVRGPPSTQAPPVLVDASAGAAMPIDAARATAPASSRVSVRVSPPEEVRVTPARRNGPRRMQPSGESRDVHPVCKCGDRAPTNGRPQPRSECDSSLTSSAKSQEGVRFAGFRPVDVPRARLARCPRPWLVSCLVASDRTRSARATAPGFPVGADSRDEARRPQRNPALRCASARSVRGLELHVCLASDAEWRIAARRWLSSHRHRGHRSRLGHHGHARLGDRWCRHRHVDRRRGEHLGRPRRRRP